MRIEPRARWIVEDSVMIDIPPPSPRAALRLSRAIVCAVAAGAAAAALAADPYLDPDVAFALSARALDASRLEVRFDVAPGYHLYRGKISVKSDPAGALGAIDVPRGQIEFDPTF